MRRPCCEQSKARMQSFRSTGCDSIRSTRYRLLGGHPQHRRVDATPRRPALCGSDVGRNQRRSYLRSSSSRAQREHWPRCWLRCSCDADRAGRHQRRARCHEQQPRAQMWRFCQQCGHHLVAAIHRSFGPSGSGAGDACELFRRLGDVSRLRPYSPVTVAARSSTCCRSLPECPCRSLTRTALRRRQRYQ